MSSRAVVISPFHLLTQSRHIVGPKRPRASPNRNVHRTRPTLLKNWRSCGGAKFRRLFTEDEGWAVACFCVRSHPRSPLAGHLLKRVSVVWRAAAAALLRKRLCRHIHQWKLGSVVASAKHKRLTCSQQRLLHACVTAHNQNERKIIFAQHKGCQVFVWQLSATRLACIIDICPRSEYNLCVQTFRNRVLVCCLCSCSVDVRHVKTIIVWYLRMAHWCVQRPIINTMADVAEA
jgi:hypothetical protein